MQEKAETRISRLVAQQRFTETLLNNLPGMAYRCANDQPWTIEFASAGCEALTGNKADFITGTRLGWLELVHVDDRDAACAAVKAALAAGEQFDIQYRIFAKDGREKWVREQGCGIYSADGGVEAIEGYIDDITSLKTAVLELRRQRGQLAHADRLHTLGEMATGIAHEINQPLAAISLFAQAGRRLLGAGDYDKLQEVLDKLSRHALRAGAIVERIQDMARRKESVRQIADLNALVDDVVELAEIDARTSDIRIEMCHGTGLPDISVDIVQIQQVVLNVLRNGIDAMRSIKCRNGNIIKLVTRHLDDRFLQVDVIDSGGGVPDDIAETIFELFSTNKSTGLGMGLPISKEIVASHGGQLIFSNNISGGATFSLTLPIVGNDMQNE